MKARISLRVSALLWSNPQRNDEVLDLLQAHPEIEEVAFFTSFTHLPLPLNVIEERAAQLAQLIPRYREIGVSAGINHLATIGHLDENLDNSLQEPWQRLTDSSGREAGSFCLSDARVRDYVRATYRALAKANPDFIWIDDDLRLEMHGPLGFSCFCSLCLANWSATTGREWTRESLVAAFDNGTRDAQIALRRQWLEHNRAYVSDGIALIRQTVNESHPQMPLGFMTTTLAYSGLAFERWARDLSGERGLENLPAKWRPGGGFYSDDSPVAILNKIHLIGAQNLIPVEVTDVQYELECFPYQPLKKSATMFAAEIAAAIGAGCTGVALNTMGTSADSLDEFAFYFERLQKTAPFFNRCVETLGRSACEGIGFAPSPDAFAVAGLGDWLHSNPMGHDVAVDELSEIGLPFSYGDIGRCVTILAGNSALLWNRDQLMEMLSGGVLLDGAALGHLNAMGLEEYTGFAVRGTRERDVLEVLSGDEINGHFAGWHRDCRPSFWPQPSFVLEPAQNGSRVLSELVDFTPQTQGATSGVFENELGGRVAVMGYYPWKMVGSLAKTEQLKTLCRWLSRDTLPAYVESFARVACWCRRDTDGNPALLILNASLDAQDVSVRVRTAAPMMRLVRMDTDEGEEEILSREGKTEDEAYGAFTISNLGAWQAALLTM